MDGHPLDLLILDGSLSVINNAVIVQWVHGTVPGTGKNTMSQLTINLPITFNGYLTHMVMLQMVTT